MTPPAWLAYRAARYASQAVSSSFDQWWMSASWPPLGLKAIELYSPDKPLESWVEQLQPEAVQLPGWSPS